MHPHPMQDLVGGVRRPLGVGAGNLFDDVYDLQLLLGAELFERPVGQHQVGATGVRQVIESIPVRRYGWQLLFLRRRFAVPRTSGNR